MSARVLIVQESLPQYRVPLFTRLRDLLAGHGVHLDVAHGQPSMTVGARRDGGTLDRSLLLHNRRLQVGGRAVVWQPVYRVSAGYELVVVEHASRLLVNYALLARQRRGGPRVALWGHGRGRPEGTSVLGRLGGTARNGISRLPHWWFPYTERGAARIRGFGFPAERITVLQNAADTSWAEHATAARVPGRCVFIGGLYPGKGVDLLVAAADRVAARHPAFTMVIVGDGPDRAQVDAWARDRPYLRIAGPLFGPEKAQELAAAELVLAPSMVGLAVLDSFAAGAPMVTTDTPGHGPEIEYLEHGRNGWIVPAGVESFADTVLTLLDRPDLLTAARAACSADAGRYSIDTMADRFTAGILAALVAAPDHMALMIPAERTA